MVLSLVCQQVRVVYTTERASPGLDDNIMRYGNSLVMVDVVAAQYKPCSSMAECLWHFQHQRRSVSIDSTFSTSHKKTTLPGSGTKCGVVRGLWNAVSLLFLIPR